MAANARELPVRNPRSAEIVGALVRLSSAEAKGTALADGRRYPEPIEHCVYFVVAEAGSRRVTRPVTRI